MAARSAGRAERMRVLASASQAGTSNDAAGVTGTRGTRLAARLAGKRLPRFDDLGALAAWRLVPPERTDALAIAAALLFHRPQIDRAVDGATLRAIAASTGEALFDAVCDLPVGAGDAAATQAELPPAGRYRNIGLSLMRRAELGHDAGIARLLDRAAGLVAA